MLLSRCLLLSAQATARLRCTTIIPPPRIKEMGAESALLGSLITTAGGLLMTLIAKIKCVYRHTEDGCQPACACMDGKLEKEQDEQEVHKVEANGIEMLYVSKKG